MARRRKMDPERKAFINSLLEHYQPKDAQDIPSMTTRTKRQTRAVMVIVLKLSPLQWERLNWIYHEIEREILNRRL